MFLAKFGGHEKFVKMNGAFHNGMMAKVCVDREDSDPFGVRFGVK